MDDYIEIAYERLAPETLQAVIEEFITREGTDYGQQEYTLAQKVAQVQRQLQAGRAIIVYEPQTQTCTLLLKQ